MRTCVILNPNAGSSDKRQKLEDHFRERATLLPVSEEGGAASTAQRMIDERYQRIIIAGGDGTVNEVVNGIATANSDVVLGIFPMGTGNDLVRTLSIPLDPDEALLVLDQDLIRRLDLIKVEGAGRTVYGVNVASGGFSGQVDANVSTELKETWGPLAYIIGAAATLSDLQEYETVIMFEDETPRSISTLNLIVANGRMIGGGKRVAPMADPEDGLLDVVVIEYGTAASRTEVAARLVAGDITASQSVLYRRVRKVQVRSSPEMVFNIDGEPFAVEDVRFESVPRVLRFLVGPDYVREPPAST